MACTVMISNAPPRVYDPTWPSDSPYRPHTRKTGYHYGQRKLLMAEIEFLTMFGDRAKNVVYVGAAPGLHLRVLVDCFPHHTFTLYDPCPFHARLQDPHWSGRGQVRLCQEVFTNATAAIWKGVPCLFISDIRHKESHEQFPSEECVWEDMDAQQRWVQTIEPVAAMLKFRLPWSDPMQPTPSSLEVTYLDGELRLPVWGCPSTTETRLHCEPPYVQRTWNCNQYERHMFYFNTEVRAQIYTDGTYDLAAEQEILRRYIDQCAPRQKSSILKQRILRELMAPR